MVYKYVQVHFAKYLICHNKADISASGCYSIIIIQYIIQNKQARVILIVSKMRHNLGQGAELIWCTVGSGSY